MTTMTKFPNGISSRGIPVNGSIPFVLGANGAGDIYFVDATNGSDGNNGLSADQAMKTLPVAYAAAGSGDTIALSTNSTHSLATGIAWTKSRINLVGMDFFGRLVQQGAKVQLATAATTAYVLKVTGTRNSFSNIKFIQGATAATGLHVLEEGGEGSLYQNCSFVFGVSDNLDLTTATEVLCGADSATFDNCLFGSDTLLTSAARTVFTIDQVTSGQEFKSNIFRDCIWMVSSSDADALLLKVAANTDVLFTNLFINPIMMASIDTAGGIALTIAGASAGSLVKGTLNFANLSTFNCASFMTTADQVMITGNIPTAATSGISVTPA